MSEPPSKSPRESRYGSSTGEPHETEDDDTTIGLLARLAGGLVEDAFINGTVFFSLITVLAGFLADGTGWAVLGLVVGGLGIVLPWTGEYRHWSSRVMWPLVGACALADVVSVVAMGRYG